MLHRFVFAGLLTLASVAQAAEKTEVLQSARDTVALSVADTEVLAFYEVIGGVYNVTLLVTDPDGSVMRARLPLVDGQYHALILGANESEPGVRVSLARSGQTLVITQGDDRRE